MTRFSKQDVMMLVITAPIVYVGVSAVFDMVGATVKNMIERR